MGFFGFGKKNTAEATVKVNYNGKEAKKGLLSLKKTIGAVITALAIKQVAQYTAQLAELGAQADSVSKNFENFAKRQGRSTEEMMAKLRKATLGMVNDLELQQRAMQAMVSGVQFDDIITSMEFVTKFASATGTDVSQKMMTTMTGLARGSAQFLDDIGIQVMGSKDVVNDAIAQMKEKMDQFTTSEDDAAVKSKQLRAEFENQKILLGKELLPLYNDLLSVLNKLVVPMGRFVRRLVQANKVLFTSLTAEQLQVDLYIEQAEQLNNSNNLFELRAKKLKQIADLESAQQRLGIDNQKRINDLKNQEIKLAGAMIRIQERQKAEGITPTPITPKPPEDKANTEKQKRELEDLWKWYDDRRAEQLKKDIKAEGNAAQSKIDIQIEALEKELEIIEEKELAEAEAQRKRIEHDRELEAMQQSRFNSAKTINNALMQLAGDNETARKAFARTQQGIAVSEAIVNVYKAGTGALADTPGGAITRILAMGSAIAAGLLEVGSIQAQHFQTGKIGDTKRARQGDNILASLGLGETVISAPQTAAHEDTLRAIQNNTANTAAGVRSMGGGDTINFYGASNEQILNVINAKERKRSTGLRI